MFDIQLSLSIFSLGAAPLTALDLAVIAETGCADLTNPAEQAKMLAKLQTGWLADGKPPPLSLFNPAFTHRHLYPHRNLFAGTATDEQSPGSVTAPVAKKAGAYGMEGALDALRKAIQLTESKIKKDTFFQFLLETLGTIKTEVVKGNRLEARFSVEWALLYYSDDENIASLLRPALTVDWANTNPFHTLAKTGKLLEILHEKNRGGLLEQVEKIQEVIARASSLIQLKKSEEARKELQMLLAKQETMPLRSLAGFGGVFYFLEGAIESLRTFQSSPTGLKTLIHRCIKRAGEDLSEQTAKRTIATLQHLLEHEHSAIQSKRDVDSVQRLIGHSKMETAGELQTLLEELKRKLETLS